jgi:4'-phosphopantetheinyl transferase
MEDLNKCTSCTIYFSRAGDQYAIGFGLVSNILPNAIGYHSLLHPEELEYLESLKYPVRRKSYLLGRISAKKALSQITPQPSSSIFIDKGVFQFPVVNYIEQKNIQVSISHCNEFGIALAFPEIHPLGIDIERIDDNKIKTIQSQLTQKEILLLDSNNLPPNIFYTILWTIKESLSKILKTGLTLDFNFFEIAGLKQSGQIWECTFTNFIQYKAISFYIDEYIISIVLPKNTIINDQALILLYENAHRVISNNVISKTNPKAQR